MKSNKKLAVLFLLTASTTSTLAQPEPDLKNSWELAFYLGTSFSKDETLTIKQEGYPDITFDASFSTKAFDSQPYYGIRLSRWREGHAFELEHIHQKIYVDELPPDVQHFEVTDGYNLFLFNSAWQLKQYNLITWIGAGLVIAHPQITVRNMTNYTPGGGAIPVIRDSDSGYQWAGASVQAALEKEFRLTKRWLLSIEGKITHAQADIDIEGGNVVVPNTAIHIIGGVKFDFL